MFAKYDANKRRVDSDAGIGFNLADVQKEMNLC